MNTVIGFLEGKKTYIIATLTVVIGLVNVLTGTETWSTLAQDPNVFVILAGLGLGSLRAGVAKVGA